jgi:hypothetical protein
MERTERKEGARGEGDNVLSSNSEGQERSLSGKANVRQSCPNKAPEGPEGLMTRVL